MHKCPEFANLVDVLAVDFQVPHAVGAGAGGVANYRRGAEFSRPNPFARPQLAGLDVVLAVFAPEPVVGGAADRLGGALQVQVDDASGRVLENAELKDNCPDNLSFLMQIP